MWPRPGEALSHVINGERLIEEIYAEALRQWLPDVTAAVLHTDDVRNITLTAASPPPDPGAVRQVLNSWARITDELIVPYVLMLYDWCVQEAWQALAPAVRLPDGALALAREAARLAAVRRAEAMPGWMEHTVYATVAEFAEDQPRRVRDALEPGSQQMRRLSKEQGHQAAGVMNKGVLDSAMLSDEELEKTWIATIDERTRETHFAADGQRAPLTGMFRVGEAEMAYPGDPAGPPEEVISCRCRLGILAPDEELPSEVDRHTERGPGDATVRNRRGGQADEIERRRQRGTIRAREDPEGLGRTAALFHFEEDSMADAEAKELAKTEMKAEAPPGFRTFTDATIALLGVPTSDKRMLAKDIDLKFRDFPLPLMWCRQTGQGHNESFTVGVIETARCEDDKVLASGYMLNTAEADQACGEIMHRVTSPSVDLGNAVWKMTDEQGAEISSQEVLSREESGQPVIMMFTSAELLGTTLVAKAAFGSTAISLNEAREAREVAVVASAAENWRPRVYDHRLFSDPQLCGPTLPTIGDDGRVYGHLALFGKCHRSIQRECLTAPRSPSSYSHFHTSPAVRLDNGLRLPVGRLTVGCGHADPSLSGSPAMAHYDTAGTCFALVRAGEDNHGIWFSGVVAPWATPEQVEQGLSAPLSGDWRDFGSGLDLIAVLAVNTPGYAARGYDDDQGRPLALVASLSPTQTLDGGMGHLSRAELKAIMLEALAEAHVDKQPDAAALLARAQTKLGALPTPNDEIAALLSSRN